MIVKQNLNKTTKFQYITYPRLENHCTLKLEAFLIP